MNQAKQDRAVFVTGLGVVSALGIGRTTFWSSLLAGASGIGPVGMFDTSGHFTHNGGEIRDFIATNYISVDTVLASGRATHFLMTASRVAFDDAGKPPFDPTRAGIFMGSTMGSGNAIDQFDEDWIAHGIPSTFAAQTIFPHRAMGDVARMFDLQGPAALLSNACAAGNYAIAAAFDAIQLGRCDIAFVGGFDTFSRVPFTGFNQVRAMASERCQPFDLNRKGMMLGEGAGVLVLEAAEHVRQRGGHAYAEIAGFGHSCDAHHMTTPAVEGLARCIQAALDHAGVTPADVDYISAHGTGTAANDANESAAIHRVFAERARTVPTSSIKSMLGHTLGAASALEAIACCLSIEDGIIPPTINFETADPACDLDCVPNTARRHRVDVALNNAFAFGGNNCCVVLRHPRSDICW